MVEVEDMAFENLVKEKSKQFAIRIVRLYQMLHETQNEYVLSKQVLRSGTSIGANIAEAVCAMSRKDFLAKLYVAYKEYAETMYWLELLHDTDYLPEPLFQSLYQDNLELYKLLTSIIKTTKKTLDQQ